MGVPESLHLHLAFHRRLLLELCQPRGQGVLQWGFLRVDHTPECSGPKQLSQDPQEPSQGPSLKGISSWSAPLPPSTSSLGPAHQKNYFSWSLPAPLGTCGLALQIDFKLKALAPLF